jgi:protein TonB
MRFYLFPIALLAGSTALAGTGSGNHYTPKFARDEQPASILLFDLCQRPEYPRSSLRNEEQGTVTHRFVVSPGGRVLKAWIVRSSGYRDLDRASQDALSHCAFRPASIDGRPVQSTMELQYVWKLQ